MSGTITRTWIVESQVHCEVVLDEFDNPTKDYISEAVHESLTELFQDERVEIHSFDWSIKVNVRYGEE